MLIEQLKASVPQPLFEKIDHCLRLSHERLHRLETENRLLRELRRLDLLEKYGPAGEKLSDEQLELLEREPGVSSAEVEAESERAQLKLPLKALKKHPGRQELPAHLPRIEKIIACTPEQCVCGNCGKENSVIGYEKTEQQSVSAWSNGAAEQALAAAYVVQMDDGQIVALYLNRRLWPFTALKLSLWFSWTARRRCFCSASPSCASSCARI